jgi:hypothetical protein
VWGGHHHNDGDDDVGLEGGGLAGPCDADDAPVLLQGTLEQPADEPAFWDLRPAHRPYLVVSFLGILGSVYTCVVARIGYGGDGEWMVAQGAEHASAPCAERERAMNGSMAEWWV